jgi:hypothetical protein
VDPSVVPVSGPWPDLGAPAAAVCVAALLAGAVLVPGRGRRDGASRRHGWWRRGALSRGASGEPVVPRADAALVADLLAAAVTAGLPPGRALTAVLDALVGEGFAPEPAVQRAAARLSWGSGPQGCAEAFAEEPGRWDDVADPLLLSARTGAPFADLLRSAAASGRDRRRWEAEAAAARLAAGLVLPLGVCTLPAFLLLGVVPVVLSLAGDVIG